MTIYDRIFAGLTAHAGLYALTGDRICRGIVPPETPNPCVRYVEMPDNPVYTQDGHDAHNVSRWSFDVWGTSYENAKETAAQLVLAIKTLKTSENPKVHAVFIENAGSDIYDSATQEHGVEVEARIEYQNV